jgi:hypothetical protein
MTAAECPREQDLLDALVSARWPDRCDEGLRAHVAGCAACADIATVAVPLLYEDEQTYHNARVPPSGLVWWRAELRARQETARIASRPVTVVQWLTVACTAALVAAAGQYVMPSLRGWTTWLGGIAAAFDFGRVEVVGLQYLAPLGLLPWIALAVCLVVAPVAIYLAAPDK